MQNRFLNKTLKDLCLINQISFKSLCSGWVLHMNKNGVTRHIHGYHFDLNSDAASLIAQDKHATGCILKEQNIPVLDQVYLLRTRNKDFLIREQIQEKISMFVFPLICKPNSGSGGHNVFLTRTSEELELAITSVHKKERGVLVSEFQMIEKEYRVIVLDGEVMLIYGKKSTQEDLRHNLSRGATAILEITSEIEEKIASLAIRSMDAINLTFGAVDIIEIQKEKKGEYSYKVLEINSGVCLEHYSKINRACKEIAEGIYKKVFYRLFNIQRDIF